MKLDKKRYTTIATEKLELNSGQLDGVPTNPRFIQEEKFEALKKSISESPELLKARPLIVFPLADRFVVLCGNMRLRAGAALQMKDFPCYVLPKTTTARKLREYVLKDNMEYGQIDWEHIVQDWDKEELADWDFDLPEGWEFDDPTLDDEQQDEQTDEAQTDEHAEELLDEAWRRAADECLKQYDTIKGFSFVTPHSAKIDFINFAYYGKDYPRSNSLAFHPIQFVTSGDKYSSYEGLRKVADGESNVKGLRFVAQEKFNKLCQTTLAFGGARMPADFPADLAKSLIDEFCNEGGTMLDPCAGWGGRLVGFLASECASRYVGFDASPYQCEGDTLLFDTFKDAAKTKKDASITCKPFEKVELKSNSFDFALTSPPYFDTEKYLGGEQSRETSTSYEQWRTNFFAVLITKVYDALKPDCAFCLQVGSQSYPLLDDGKRIASKVGFSIQDVRTTSMINNYNGTEKMAGEVVIILRK